MHPPARSRPTAARRGARQILRILLAMGLGGVGAGLLPGPVPGVAWAEEPPPAAPPGAEPAARPREPEEPDEPDEPAEDPEAYEAPIYDIDSLWVAEADLPAGWAADPRGPEREAALEREVRALLPAPAAPGAVTTLRARALLGPGGGGGEFLMLASEADPAGWRSAFDRRAAERGFAVCELGEGSRLLLVRAEPRREVPLLEALRVEVVQGLCDLSHRAMRSALERQEPLRFWLAREYLQAAATMEPQAGGVRLLEAQVALALRNGERAVTLLRAALADDVAIRPRPPLAVLAAGLLGHELLARGDGPHLEEARTVLERAVAWEAHEEDTEQRFNNRYNLACVKARLGDLEPALTDLESSLRYAREHLPRIYPFAWRYARHRDPDLAKVRRDARFGPLMERVAPQG